jgi:hypothetical protein
MLTIACETRTDVSTPRLLGAAWQSEKKCHSAYKKLIEGLIKDYTKEGESPNVNTTNTGKREAPRANEQVGS